MAVKRYNGQLTVNELYKNLYNFILGIRTFADGLDGLKSDLSEKFTKEGGLYGDTFLYADPDVLGSYETDLSDTNEFEVNLANEPSTQAITINKIRQIALTRDTVLTRRAFGSEGAFEQFNGSIQAMIKNTKKLFNQRTMDVYIGTTTSSVGKQVLELDVTSAVGAATGEEKARLTSEAISEAIANLEVDLADSTRDYNDNGTMKAVPKNKIFIVWNAKWVNKILKTAQPTMFHIDGLVDGANVKPARYFGDITPASVTKADGSTHRFLHETSLKNGAVVKYGTAGSVDYFPGDLVPKDTVLAASGSITIPTYTENGNYICKVMHEDGVVFHNAFEMSTERYLAKALKTNDWLTWMYAEPAYLKNYPFIAVKAK